MSIANFDGDNVLHFVVKLQATELFHPVLQSFKDNYLALDEQDNNGMTPLLYACEIGNKMMIDAFINAKCSLTIRDNIHFKSAQDWLNTHVDDNNTANPKQTLACKMSKFQESVSHKQVDSDLHITNYRDSFYEKIVPICHKTTQHAKPSSLKNQTGASSCDILNKKNRLFKRRHSNNFFQEYNTDDLSSKDYAIHLMQLFDVYAITSSENYRTGVPEKEQLEYVRDPPPSYSENRSNLIHQRYKNAISLKIATDSLTRNSLCRRQSLLSVSDIPCSPRLEDGDQINKSFAFVPKLKIKVNKCSQKKLLSVCKI